MYILNTITGWLCCRCFCRPAAVDSPVVDGSGDEVTPLLSPLGAYSEGESLNQPSLTAGYTNYRYSKSALRMFVTLSTLRQFWYVSRVLSKPFFLHWKHICQYRQRTENSPPPPHPTQTLFQQTRTRSSRLLVTGKNMSKYPRDPPVNTLEIFVAFKTISSSDKLTSLHQGFTPTNRNWSTMHHGFGAIRVSTLYCSKARNIVTHYDFDTTVLINVLVI
jgi:hypothetical protein